MQQVFHIRHPKSIASQGWKVKALAERITCTEDVQYTEETWSKPPEFLRRGRKEVINPLGLWPGHGNTL